MDKPCKTLAAFLLLLPCAQASLAYEGLEESPLIFHPESACGPMSMAFVDAMLGGNAGYRRATELCPPSPQGVSLLDLVRAAETMGYSAKACRCGPDVLQDCKMAILSVRGADVGPSHFVVLIRYNPMTRKFDVFDPPNRLLEMEETALSARYKGICLLVGKRGEDLTRTIEAGSRRRFGISAAIAALSLFNLGLVLRAFRSRLIRRRERGRVPGISFCATAGVSLCVNGAKRFAPLLRNLCRGQPSRRARRRTPE